MKIFLKFLLEYSSAIYRRKFRYDWNNFAGLDEITKYFEPHNLVSSNMVHWDRILDASKIEYSIIDYKNTFNPYDGRNAFIQLNEVNIIN